MKQANPFSTEAELCARFIAAIGEAWTAYAETAGWDILLVRKADGFQIGIEAKLKLNAHVISQALEEYGAWHAAHSGPDCRAVMVPDGQANYFGRISAYIGLTIITVHAPFERGVRGPAFQPYLPTDDGSLREYWHEWCPIKRHTLPEYVPDVAAGVSAPTRLTQWKIAALKIAVTIEQRGFVTREDFKHHKIDHRRWLAAETQWLQNDGGKYVAGERFPNFKAQHPKVYAEIAADAKDWLPKVAVQTGLFAGKSA